MSGVYIAGMKMPTTGLYFVSVDNTNGRDKTIVTVERMLGNRDVRQIIGSYELVPVPDHGRLIEKSALHEACYIHFEDFMKGNIDGKTALLNIEREIKAAPTIIPADMEAGE